jgi:hypothetical protein
MGIVDKMYRLKSLTLLSSLLLQLPLVNGQSVTSAPPASSSAASASSREPITRTVAVAKVRDRHIFSFDILCQRRND